jgi:hypothetical protein
MNSIDHHLIKPAPPHLSSQSFSGTPVEDAPRKPLPPGYHLLLGWPIARRLVLGFLTAAVIAATVSSITGIERTNTLQNQAQFYRGLVDSNSQLTKGDGYLQLMNTSLNQALADAAQNGISLENQNQTIRNVQGLANSYDTILTSYAQHNLIDENPNQQALINEAGSSNLIIKQRTLASSIENLANLPRCPKRYHQRS